MFGNLLIANQAEDMWINTADRNLSCKMPLFSPGWMKGLSERNGLQMRTPRIVEPVTKFQNTSNT